MTHPPFSKILIANRGEIAVRIARTCREMGIRTVAIYSEPDKNALHVQTSDEAYCVGPASAALSYLNVEAIVEIALQSGAEAIHPGYGFLAENASFACAVESAGLVWIGPRPHVIDLMGDKVASKKLARSVGVPVVPGYEGDDQSAECMAREAEKIGYPVMLKASAGGGGKGMRTVESAQDLPQALEGAQRESRAAFGDDRIFLEKLVVNPRHIEIQIFLDTHGNAVYLGERDCSIQRRHQKVVEEAPSIFLTDAQRREMGAAALRLARASNYTNAGTVEFLYSEERYYFLEMNTRIQVEHPVTEMVSGLDLVNLQIRVAAGEQLGVSQLDVRCFGHAIEARIYAEDADSLFLPSTGRISLLRLPEGPGIRNDVGVFEGFDVTPYFDPLLAKCIVHATTRQLAITRLRAALNDYAVQGLTTNLPFLTWLVNDPNFVKGTVDIGFVERAWRPGERPNLSLDVLAACALFQALGNDVNGAVGESDVWSPWNSTTGWRLNGLRRSFRYGYGGEEYDVYLTRDLGDTWVVASGGERKAYEATAAREGVLIARHGQESHRYTISRRLNVIVVSDGVNVYKLTENDAAQTSASHRAGTTALGEAVAPMPGTVIKVAVSHGQRVSVHEPLIVLEAMKMEHVIEAPRDGIVRSINYAVGDLVPAGARVVELDTT